MQLKTLKAQFTVEFLDLPAAAQIDDAAWEAFQIQFLNNSRRFGIDTKARQIAWSFTAALDAVVDSILNEGTPHIFVSINQDEAKEKVRYARNIVEALDEPVRPRLVRDSQTEIEFDNGSRLISHPCRPPRGKPRARIYLDEMAHYAAGMDREVYRAALPATVKGDGYVRIGSSPMGASGLFWEIFTETLRGYPGYLRRMIPWWYVRALCKDVPMAVQIAPEMVTEERVRAFGTPALVEIFENMFLEDFQQEYECSWIDEATSWITWDVIKRNQDLGLLWWHARSVDEALGMIPLIQQAIDQGTIESALAGGVDVGRKRNLTEFIAVGKTTTGRLPIRFMVSLSRVEYDDQQRCFVEIVNRLPFTKVLVDQNGIGAQLAENLARITGRRAEGVDFTNPNKELWAVESRIQAERGNTPLPLDRDLAYQIHAIKKKVTAAKNAVFDNERNEKHHCYDADTEILTESGWIPFPELLPDHKVATLDDGYLRFERPLAIQVSDYAGDMVRVKNKQVDLFVTPNHRMFVKGYYRSYFEFLPAAAVLERPNHRWHYKKDAKWNGDDAPPVPVGSPELLAELLGYYLSEGCKASQYRVIFYQNAGALADRMIDVLQTAGKKNMTVSPTERGALRIECYWKKLHQWLPDGTAPNKEIPRAILGWSPRLLRILFNALMEGDGARGRDGKGTWTYYTTSRQLADDVTDLLLRIGWCGTVVQHDTSHPDSWNKRPLWRVNINRTRLTPITNKREPSHWREHYEGPVYCATTRNHLLYVRRNGSSVWCGNSDKYWAWALALWASRTKKRKFIKV